MEIATLLFTYNRPYHTGKVLEGLKKNEILPSKLIIFQDGMNESTDISDWKKVGQIIQEIEWCNTEVHITHINKGLAESIISGVTYALEKYDAVIVLEDDCVPHRKFMPYMISCLNKYENAKQVYSVGGCSWPVTLQKGENDAYFCGRISSLGWGTWKDRWIQYERDYTMLKRIMDNKQAKERLEIWGNDLEKQLFGNITGQNDSWAVFWALKVIEKGGYCLSPYESLITNIGFDGTGRHSGTKEMEIEYRAANNMNDYVLPETIQFSEECKKKYRELLSVTPPIEKFKCYQTILISWIMRKQKGKDIRSISKNRKTPIAVWGKGQLCDLLIQEWEGIERIEYIIESKPRLQRYHDIPVISINELPLEIKTIVVIPVYDMEVIERKIKESREDINVIGINELVEADL